MLKRNLILLCLAVLVAATASCIFDPKKDEGDDDDKPKQSYQDLTQKWHVLNNLELAYRDRLVNRYQDVLDPQFTFFFSEGDVGGEVPEQWGRDEEIEATTRLFDKTLNDPNFPRCKSIAMDLVNEQTVNWVSVVPEAFPDETWYTANVFYDFQFELEPDLTLIPFLGSKGQFTVRDVGTPEKAKWQLVEFRDLGGAN